MRRWIALPLGVVLVVAGLVWTLQGLNLLGQSGGMNGQTIWAIIGPVTAVIGLGLAAFSIRARRPARGPSAPR